MPVEGQGGSHCRTCTLIATDIRVKITSGGSRRGTVPAARARRNSVTGGARLVAAGATGGVLVVRDCADPSKAMVFRTYAPPPGACENLVCAVNLWANQQTGGDSLMDTQFESLQEQSKGKSRMSFGGSSRWTITKIDDLEKNSETIKVVGPDFNRPFPRRGGPRRSA